MADRLLTADEIITECIKLDDVVGAEAGYFISGDRIMRKIDGKSVSYTTADLLMPMSQFSKRILIPLIGARRVLDDNSLTSAFIRPETVRGSTHGDYTQMSQVIQETKAIWRSGPSWGQLSAPQKEALELIATKVGRIVCGDPNHRDHWDDIGGYARKSSETMYKE